MCVNMEFLCSNRDLCDEFFNIIKKNTKNEVRKVLNAPVNIAAMAKEMENVDKNMQSIWLTTKDGGSVST